MTHYEIDKYEYSQERTGGGWILLILGTIAAAVSVYPWLNFYHGLKACGRNFVEALDKYTKVFALFAGLTLVWFILTTFASVRFSRQRRVWRTSPSPIVGGIFIFLEYAIYAAAIAIWFLR
jgi:hypothetical protein